jgi:uncharacterized protein (DUF1810 family)
MTLERFLDAQANPRVGYENAVAELRAGAKRSHWIWWIFPQIAGLGESSTSVRYALADLDEALAYLRHPTLGMRIAEAVGLVRRQCSGQAAIPLETLMGSRLDALKLVSCLTLFARVGRGEPAAAALVEDADAVLRIAATQGIPRCAFTERA